MQRPRILCAGLILAALAILITGAAMAQTTIHARLLPVSTRIPAPAFTLQDAAGKPFSLASLRGKVVVLDFWATWCGGCKEELPWFSQLDTKYAGRGMTVVGASVDDGGWALVKKYLSAHPVRYTMVVADKAMQRHYGVDAMPNTFLIDRHGRLAASYIGGLANQNGLEAQLRALLQER